jgi:hypothetical protein
MIRKENKLKKEISKRWKLDVRHIVEENDMTGVFVFDSQFRDSVMEANGKIVERKGDNDLDLTPKCDFCGSHLRYVSVIEASNMNAHESGDYMYRWIDLWTCPECLFSGSSGHSGN